MDAALLHTNDMLVRDPTFYQGICSAFPGRFYAMAPSNEALITTDSAAAVEGIRRHLTTAQDRLKQCVAKRERYGDAIQKVLAPFQKAD